MSKDPENIPLEEQPVSYFRIGAFFALALLLGYLLVWLVRDSNNEPVEVYSEQEIREYRLPDGSVAWMNRNSYLRHPIEFDKTVRKVNADGEFWLELEPEASGPFMLAIPGGVVQVKGKGKFHVRSLMNQDLVEVNLAEGSAVFEIGKGRFQQLTPGDHMVFEVKSGDLRVKKYANDNYNYWLTGELTFDKTPLAEVLQDLARCYGATFGPLPEGTADCRISERFTGAALPEVLAALSTQTGLEFREDKQRVEIAGSGCGGELEE